jgi:hypothetical protein
MMKWMTATVVVLAMMSASWFQGRPAASAAPTAASDDPLGGEAAARHRQCQPTHWTSYALQPRF